MKTKAILYTQHDLVAEIPLCEIEFIYAQGTDAEDAIRVDTTDCKHLFCDEIEFI